MCCCAQGIPIDYVAGVSAGSIIGAALCAGLSLETLNELAPQINWRHIARLVFPRRGFVSFKKLERFVAGLIDDRQFHEMKIPFIAVVTDLLKGEPVILREGYVATAVHASLRRAGLCRAGGAQWSIVGRWRSVVQFADAPGSRDGGRLRDRRGFDAAALAAQDGAAFDLGRWPSRR